MDGSAVRLFILLMQGGLKELDAPKNLLKYSNLLKHSSTTNAPFSARMRVSNSTSPLTFDHPAFKKEYQSATIDFSTETFVYEVSEARTFGFMKDLDYLKANNLALRASLDNAIGVMKRGGE